MNSISDSEDQVSEVNNYFSDISYRYVFCNHVLSFFCDILWRKKVAKLVKNKFKNKRIKLLDAATGSGDLLFEIYKILGLSSDDKSKNNHTSESFYGIDINKNMLKIAKKKGLNNLLLQDLKKLSFKNNYFDCITIGFGIRNVNTWQQGFNELFRVLKPKGVFIILDFSMPDNKLIKLFYKFYLLKIIPIIGAIITGNRSAYDYLGQSILNFPHGDEMKKKLEDLGAKNVTIKKLNFKTVSIYQFTK